MQDKTESFVTFYSKNNISPVSQDISDLEKHFQRRESLFRSLGILPNFVRGVNVIEFGPGSGHNSTYMASLKPQKYYLVEGNPLGIKQTQELLSGFGFRDFHIFKSLFLDYSITDKFDIIWAEGCIPHQNNPITILKHLASFSRKGGLFVCTTSNAISYLSETIRRLILNVYFPSGISSLDLDQALENLKPLFASHLSNLKGMSRPIDDWIVDNILQPLQGRKLLSIPDVIATLNDEYDLYGSSPRFITDWRWYKEIIGEERKHNQNALTCYYKSNLNLIDYRYVFAPQSVEFGKELEAVCARSWELMSQIQHGDASKWQSMFDLMDEISSVVMTFAPDTAKAIVEASQWLQDGVPLDRELSHFPQWWGRGQQYLSFVHKAA